MQVSPAPRRPVGRSPEEATTWVWVLGFVVVCAVIVVVISRRGPGDGSNHGAAAKHDPYQCGGYPGGGFGDAGGV